MLSIGALIWISFRPLLRLVICTACGFFLSRAGLLPLPAARGASQIALNITIPSLLFSKILPAFTSQNIGALGPLVLVAVLYQGMGMAGAFILEQFFWVPHRFRYGIMVAGCWANVGDIPTAILLSVTASAPFNPATDPTTAVAYSSVFILVFLVTLFPLGGHRLVAMDFEGPDVPMEELKLSVKRKRKEGVLKLINVSKWTMSPILKRRSTSDSGSVIEKGETRDLQLTGPEVERKESAQSEKAESAEPESLINETASQTQTSTTYQQPAPASKLSVFLTRLRYFANSFFNPPTISILTALPISLVPSLKALFVPGVAGTHIPNAPDGQPPLAFVLDAATFIGAASVPLGLICLGSALSRLRVPRKEWGNLPLGAIMSLAVVKMIVLPVVSVAICQGLAHVGFIDPKDKVLRFVCIVAAGVPTATTQVFLTQVYSGTGESEHLAAFLIPQYAIMFFTMTILIAYGIHVLF